MRKTSLIATTVTLALTGAPLAPVAIASTIPDPIAHAAQDPIAHAAHHHAVNAPDRPVVRIAQARKACASESHKHVKGQKGTPFSQCVHALKTLGTGAATSPKAACQAESHTHVKGTKGTAFSRCVVAARKLAHTQTHTRSHSHAAAAAGPR